MSDPIYYGTLHQALIQGELACFQVIVQKHKDVLNELNNKPPEAPHHNR